MADFSDNFIGIDDRIYGDGAADSTTQPHDALLEQLQDSSLRWLVRRQHLAAQTKSGDDRTYASLQWMAIYYTPIYLHSGISLIGCKVPAIISSAIRESEGGTSDIQARLRVLGVGLSEPVTWTGDGTQQAESVEFQISGAGEGFTLAFLEVLSEDEGLRSASANFDDATPYYLPEQGGGDDLDEGDYISGQGQQIGEFVPIGEVDYNAVTNASDTGWPTLTSLPPPAGTQDFDIRSMTYIQPRGCWWYTEVSDDEQSPSYTPKPQRTMLPNEDVLGQHTITHQRNIDGVYSRPELVAAGPQMVDEPNATWGTKHQRWPTVYANDGSDQALGDLTFYPGRDTSTIKVICWIQFAHVVLNQTVLGTIRDPALSRQQALRDATLMKWSVTANVKQLSGTGSDWSSTTATATQSVDRPEEPHWLANWVLPIPILKSAFYSYYHQDSDGEDGYMWYEGALYQGLGDISTLVPVTINVDLDATSMDMTNPARIEITASPDTSTITYQVPASEHDTDRIMARCVSMGIFEIGDSTQ
jgi:hypothetical protein